MATTTAGTLEDDLADLDFAGHERRLELLDRERDKRLHPVHRVRDDKATGPPSPPLPAASRSCACTPPLVDDERDRCLRCGKSLCVGPSLRANEATRPRPPGTREGPSQPDRTTAEAGPWSDAQVEELRELLRRGESAAWAVGDHVLELVPMGASKATSGALARLGELAALAGCEVQTLRRARSVAFAWPTLHRVENVSMGAHGAYTLGGPAKAAERAGFLRRLADENGGKLAADAVREARGLQRCRPLADPVRSLCQRIDSAHGLLVKLPDQRPTNGHATTETLRRRAEQCREVADRLEALAACRS